MLSKKEIDKQYAFIVVVAATLTALLVVISLLAYKNQDKSFYYAFLNNVAFLLIGTIVALIGLYNLKEGVISTAVFPAKDSTLYVASWFMNFRMRIGYVLDKFIYGDRAVESWVWRGKVAVAASAGTAVAGTVLLGYGIYGIFQFEKLYRQNAINPVLRNVGWAYYPSFVLTFSTVLFLSFLLLSVFLLMTRFKISEARHTLLAYIQNLLIIAGFLVATLFYVRMSNCYVTDLNTGAVRSYGIINALPEVSRNTSGPEPSACSYASLFGTNFIEATSPGGTQLYFSVGKDIYELVSKKGVVRAEFLYFPKTRTLETIKLLGN